VTDPGSTEAIHGRARKNLERKKGKDGLMIAKLDISGVHMEVDKKLNEYVVKKIGKIG
jgi:hypothetical protein